MKKVSIIMPVYNAGKYIDECLRSVKNQSYRDFECICVDDGSTDNSVEVVKRYCSADGRFLIVEGGHKNAGAARNVGMGMSSGDYLIFLDSDDVFSPELLRTLVSGIERNDADISSASYATFVDGQPIPEFHAEAEPEWEVGKIGVAGSFSIADFSSGAEWTMFRRELVVANGITFLEQPSDNDSTFVWTALASAEKIAKTSAVVVAYRLHRTSIQGKKDKSPECFINSSVAYVRNIRRLGLAERRQLILRQFAECYLRDVLTELSTMRLRGSYERFYNGIISAESEVNVLPNVRNGVNAPQRCIRRYGRIVKPDCVERLRFRVERFLAPIIGPYYRTSGFRHYMSGTVKFLVQYAFDSVSMILERR